MAATQQPDQRVAGSARRAHPDEPRRPVRERILDAANALFYADGIRAVSADRVIAAAGVSKVTFYRHFPTKDDLVVAYLGVRAAAEREVVGTLRARHAGDPCGMLTELARSMAGVSCAPGFRGCPFINAAAEYPDAGHPVRQAVAAHRAWFTGLLGEVLGELDVADPAVVDRLMMLRDGAMVAGYLGGSDLAAGLRTDVGSGRGSDVAHGTDGTDDRADDGVAARAETLVEAGRAIIAAAR